MLGRWHLLLLALNIIEVILVVSVHDQSLRQVFSEVGHQVLTRPGAVGQLQLRQVVQLNQI